MSLFLLKIFILKGEYLEKCVHLPIIMMIICLHFVFLLMLHRLFTLYPFHIYAYYKKRLKTPDCQVELQSDVLGA